jgi:hypothetical protein
LGPVVLIYTIGRRNELPTETISLQPQKVENRWLAARVPLRPHPSCGCSIEVRRSRQQAAG